MFSNKILIVRSAPAELFLSVTETVRREWPKGVLYGLIQDDVLDLADLSGIKAFAVPSGPLLINRIGDEVLDHLRRMHFKRLVVPLNGTSMAGYKEIFHLADTLGIPETVTYTRNLQKRCLKSPPFLLQLLVCSALILINGLYRLGVQVKNFFKNPRSCDCSGTPGDTSPRAGLFSYGYIPTSPVLLPLCRELIRRGFRIDFFHIGAMRNADHEGLGPDFHLYRTDPSGKKEREGRIMSGMMKLLRDERLKEFIMGTRWFIDRLPKTLDLSALTDHVCNRPYRLLIGFEERGFDSAVRFAERLSIGVPLVYWNLELNMKGVVGREEYLQRKAFERIHKGQMNVVVVQDSARQEALEQSLSARYVQVPVALDLPPLSSSHSRYLQKKFGIADDFPIVLYSGSILRFHGLRVLLESALGWPDHWHLVIHGRGDNSHLEELRLLAYDHKQIHFSTDLLDEDELYSLIASAHIGVSLFDGRDANLTHTARSSGKVAQYLRCGLPIVVNEASSSRFLTKNQPCAVLISKPGQIREAVQTILDSYENYRQSAFDYYETYYRIEPHLDTLLNVLPGLRR